MIGHVLSLATTDGLDVAECSCGWTSPPCGGCEHVAQHWADHMITATNPYGTRNFA